MSELLLRLKKQYIFPKGIERLNAKDKACLIEPEWLHLHLWSIPGDDLDLVTRNVISYLKEAAI